MPLFNFEIAFKIVLNFLSKSNVALYQDTESAIPHTKLYFQL